MTKKNSTKRSKILLPIIIALIACLGTIIAALIGSDYIKEIVNNFYPQPGNAGITVHVADKSGKAISGAQVLIFYSAGSLSQYTDSNGVSTFSIDGPVRGNVRLIVESSDYQIYEKQIIFPIETTLDVRLIEKQGQNENIILRTIRESDSEPVNGIEVIVSFNGEIVRQTTDSDGFAVYTLPFSSKNTLDVQISVNAQGFKIENQFSTLTPGKLQYILLTPNSLRVELPNIPTPGSANPTAPAGSPGSSTEPPGGTGDVSIGSGIDISKQAGGNGLKVVLLTPDSHPWENVYVEVYEQVADASGNPSRGNRVKSGNINLQGEIAFDLQTGTYAVCPGENRGYGWTDKDCIYNIEVDANNLTVVKLQEGQIEFAIVDANGKPWENVYFEVYTQKKDVNGNPVTANRVWSGNTANTGIADVWLTPGMYSVSLDLRGYNWGSLSDKRGEVNVPVQKGIKTPILIKMGRITVGLTKSDGTPNTNVYFEIYTQKKDVTGKSATSDRIWSGNTDNGGLASIDLTQGMYAIKIGDNILYDVSVNWGKVSQTDGVTFQQK
jgi:hypothetical protein